MRMRMIALLLGAGAAALSFGQSARADFALSFGQSNYNVVEGGTVDVDVFLVEDAPGTILFDEGLFSAAVRVFFNEDPRTSDPAQVIDRSANSGFDVVTLFDIIPATATTTGEANLIADAIGTPPVTSSAGSPQSLYLGTFRFLVGTIVGEVTQIRIDVDDPQLVNFATGAGEGIPNAQIRAGLGTITVIPIPEPSALALTGLGMAGLGIVAHRRRARSAR